MDYGLYIFKHKAARKEICNESQFQPLSTVDHGLSTPSITNNPITQ
ncbi:hypothetical protein C943_04401 [Mariniradius saccharolyticus AK6]|uniref:Uncharacterized protein n=1 Tax=Mariniradius saccharolyticus AK6 TaxID=1239962 RepID=M7XG47_9BACT|nr:hypothetical protein C943_04401 [Mariniradius saccharolyticus AK6]